MIIDILDVGMYHSNCYLVGCEKTHKGIIIDPGDEGDFIVSKVKDNNLKIEKIVLTHGHLDHIGAVEYLKNLFDAEVCIHKADADMLSIPEANLSSLTPDPISLQSADVFLEDGEKIVFGETELTVLHTPGHTPGGISLYGEGVVFTGDTIFFGSVGRTDLPYGDFDQLMESIKTKIFTLPDDTVVYPGHGPETTIGNEKQFNLFVGQ